MPAVTILLYAQIVKIDDKAVNVDNVLEALVGGDVPGSQVTRFAMLRQVSTAVWEAVLYTVLVFFPAVLLLSTPDSLKRHHLDRPCLFVGRPRHSAQERRVSEQHRFETPAHMNFSSKRGKSLTPIPRRACQEHTSAAEENGHVADCSEIEGSISPALHLRCSAPDKFQ